MSTPPDRRIPARLAGIAALLASLLVAGPASASEGLVLVPEPWKFGPLLIAFVVLVPLLNVLLFRPLFRVLDERTERIDGAKARADQLSRQAADVIARYEAAVRDAHAAADVERKRALEVAQREQASAVAAERSEAERTIESARREVGRAISDAREFLRRDAESLARDAASRVLGRGLQG